MRGDQLDQLSVGVLGEQLREPVPSGAVASAPAPSTDALEPIAAVAANPAAASASTDLLAELVGEMMAWVAAEERADSQPEEKPSPLLSRLFNKGSAKPEAESPEPAEALSEGELASYVAETLGRLLGKLVLPEPQRPALKRLRERTLTLQSEAEIAPRRCCQAGRPSR